MITVTLAYQDIWDFVTGNGSVDVGQSIIDAEIERYAQAIANKLGSGFEVEVSNILETSINGRPSRYSDYAETVADAEATVVEFW